MAAQHYTYSLGAAALLCVAHTAAAVASPPLPLFVLAGREPSRSVGTHGHGAFCPSMDKQGIQLLQFGVPGNKVRQFYNDCD